MAAIKSVGLAPPKRLAEAKTVLPALDWKVPLKAVVGVPRVRAAAPSLMILPAPLKTPVALRLVATLRRAEAPAATEILPVVAPAQPFWARSVPVRTLVPPVWVSEPPAVSVLPAAAWITSSPEPETSPE